MIVGAGHPVALRLHAGARRVVGPCLAVLGAALVAACLGAVVGGQGSLPGLLGGLGTLPIPALLGLVVAIAALPLLLRDWRVGVAAFLVWLPFEDLVRKYAGNDLRVYFVKEVLYGAALLGAARELRRVHAWRRATGRARLALLALLAWAAAMALPAALTDWRLPLIGLRLEFAYAPLVGVGYLLAVNTNRFSRAMRGFAVLAGVVLSLGVIQAIVGPEFLSPGKPTPGLKNLLLVRGLPGTAPVYRPTGTFVDPGRYASMAGVGLAVGLAALLLRVRSSRVRVGVVAAVGVAAVAMFVNGGRGSVVLGLALVVAALVGASRSGQGVRSRHATGVVVLAVAAVGLFFLAVPDVAEGRFQWFSSTLDPGSPDSEWGFRWDSYSADAVRGVENGGLVGRGTGTQALGQEYLYEGQTPLQGRYTVESGYGTVAVELGVVGLALWVCWSVAWFLRLRRCAVSVRGSPLAGVATVLNAWILFFLFVNFFGGMQGFQNYVANAYFWLFSGIVFGLPTARTEAADRQRARRAVHLA